MKKTAGIKIGSIVRFKTFSYTNTAGGTGSADNHPITDLDMFFEGVAQGEVVYLFHDWECGWRFHVKLDEAGWELIKDVASENKAYVSEFDLC